MKKVERHEIPALAAYARMRDDVRRSAMATKELRRVHLGSHLTFLFENRETVRYQVLEMLRAEAKSSEDDVRHELDTYNELLGEDGELGCTLLIEIDDALQRDLVLRRWRALPEHLYARTLDGRRVYARYDARQVGEDRLSAVQYLKFAVGGEAPIALGTDLPGLEFEVEIGAATRAALVQDLSG
jgi:hypothetical protein